jgi:hypothetical protein
MLQKLSIQSRLLLWGLLMLSLIGTTLYLPSTMSANAKLVSQTTRLDQQIRAANEVRNSFGEYRSWISDMAVSLMATRKSIFSATLPGRRSTPAATRVRRRARGRVDDGIVRRHPSQPPCCTGA